MDSAEIQRIKLRYGIVGNNDALNRALDIALKIAPVDLSVLITGENGVGKEIFPRVIHDYSLRKGKKYLAVNCGAIPEGTIDSELFGHEKGAFTGAVEKREGYFAVADGGTLFLDEVGELPLSTQARLLRVLETGEYIPVGASETRRTNVRIVAATNVNIEEAIHDGKFREDLYYRLCSVSISVPPLRQRGEDILLLFRKFALDMGERYKMPPVRLDDSAGRMLMAYSWPGNVRQLKHIAENMSVTSEERTITADILSRYLPEEKRLRPLVDTRVEKDVHSFENEREILYRILFDLRRDVTELKRIVSGADRKDMETWSKELLQEESVKGAVGTMPTLYKSPGINTSAHGHHFPENDETSIQEAEEVRDNESEPVTTEDLSLENMERISIRKALSAHRGNRRAAAADLGISERTLYRKIKDYGLE